MNTSTIDIAYAKLYSYNLSRFKLQTQISILKFYCRQVRSTRMQYLLYELHSIVLKHLTPPPSANFISPKLKSDFLAKNRGNKLNSAKNSTE